MRSEQFYGFAQRVEYPFDDSASLIDDAGQRLPEGLLADVSGVIDSELSNRVFVSSIRKTEELISLVISAANDDNTPLALLSVPASKGRPHRIGMSPQHPLQALTSHFRGQVVLGDKWEEFENGSWTFSKPQNSILAARCCFPISTPGSQRISVMNAPRPLVGRVSVRSEGDITATVESRTLGDEEKQAVVLSLSTKGALRDYAGPSGGRPESRTCGDPQPVETINGVAADCCNRVYIELRGCSQPIPITNHCGVVLDCPLTFEDICPPDPEEEESSDECLIEGESNPIQPAEDQPGYPIDPPRWRL